MYIEDVKTGQKFGVSIEHVLSKDLKAIKKDRNFRFDWSKYKNEIVYKLRVNNEEKIYGLMCIIDHTEEETNAIEIELLEVGDENVGKKKKLDRIAAILISFAFRESIIKGHEGYLFLTPKTDLIDHYQAKYNLAFTGPIGANLVRVMVGDEKIARRLIKEYLE